MGSRGGGGNNGGGVQGIPASSRKMVQSLKEIVNGVSDAEIYSALKDCNMDPNEAVNRLLSQDPFHEVKSKREKKKEFKDTESRPRGGGSTSNRGARSGTDRYSARGGSSQYNSSGIQESGGLHGKSKRENGTSSYTNSYTSSSAPTYGVTATNTNRIPQTYSSSVGYENKASNFNATDGTTTVPHQQPSSGYQSAWLGAPGQKSMAEIVKMGRPQNKPYNPPVQSQTQSTHYEDYVSKPIDTHQEHDSGADNFVSPDDDWPVMEQSQPVGVQSVLEPHAESENLGQSQTNLTYENNNQYIGSQTDDVQEEDENVFEDQSTNHVQDTSGTAPYYDNDYAFEKKDVEENDASASASSINANMQQLNIQEEKQLDDEPEEEIPSVVIPNHLQVQTADCSHLSFGSFGATMNQGYSGTFGSQQLRNNIENTPVEPETSSVDPSEIRNSEYYNDESIIPSENNAVHRVGPNSGSYDLPTASQTEVLKQENPQTTQYSYTFDSTQLSNPSFPQSAQLPNTTPFSNVMQAAYTNTLLATNGNPVRESDLSYSQFPINQSMATKYGASVSPITGSTISMTEALKTGVFSSSSQPPPGNTIPTGPTLPQHLAVHPYTQQPLPLTPFTNMIYPFLPQSYTYMPSGFQQAFAAGNSTYHQQLAAVLPQYKNSVSVSSLPQSAAAVPSGYGSFGNSATIPGNYQVNGSNLSYDDVLNAHYKENSQLLSLQQQQQQQNDNSGMWVHGYSSRTMPASTYYSFQGQSQTQQQQQPTGFRQGQQLQQQPTQSYGGQAAAHNYPNYYHSQTQDHHQLQQNPRDSVGGGQPKPQQQSQQLWQNTY